MEKVSLEKAKEEYAGQWLAFLGLRGRRLVI